MASGYPTSSPHQRPKDNVLIPQDRSWGTKEYTHSYQPVTLPSLFSDNFFLGFTDQLMRWTPLTSVQKPLSFPPYNLIKVNKDSYIIELAIAGYTKDDVEITVEKDLLVVKSTTEAIESQDKVIHQGIAERQWTQKFILGEYMEVKSAQLKDGLLTITVERELPEDLKPKSIKIK